MPVDWTTTIIVGAVAALLALCFVVLSIKDWREKRRSRETPRATNGYQLEAEEFHTAWPWPEWSRYRRSIYDHEKEDQ